MPYEEVRVRVPIGLRILSVAALGAFLLGWELVVRLDVVPSTMLASPSQVMGLFAIKLTDPQPDGAVLHVHIWTSIQEAFTGYFLSLLVGIPLGLLMG
jgi:NitT/TauT family transport system permease protein